MSPHLTTCTYQQLLGRSKNRNLYFLMGRDYILMTGDLTERMPYNVIYSSVRVHTFWVVDNYIIKYRLPQACHYSLLFRRDLIVISVFICAFHWIISNHFTNIISLILRNSFANFPI